MFASSGLVEADPREHRDRLRPERSGWERRDDLSKVRLGTSRVAGLEVQERCLDSPTHGVFLTIGRRQLLRALEEQRRRTKRSSVTCMPRRTLERERGSFVRLVDRRRHLPCASLGIVEQPRESAVNFGPTNGEDAS